MRNRKKQEANIFINNATAAMREAQEAICHARHILMLDMCNPSNARTKALEKAAQCVKSAADAAGKAATDINPDRYENTDLWDYIFAAHRDALDAAEHGWSMVSAIKGWLS